MQTRLLLDANLSWRSVGILKQYFDDCCHVDDIGLSVPAKDTEIWEYAKQQEMIIVTNDEDYSSETVSFFVLYSVPKLRGNE